MSNFLKKFGAVLILAAMLGGCKEEMPSLMETTSGASATTAVPAKEDKETSTATSENNTAERTALEDQIKQAAGDGKAIENELFEDFDGDGSEELIALCSYNWWYTNGRKTYTLKEYAGNYTASRFDTGEQKVVILIDYTNTVRHAYLYTFKDGEVTELDASGKFGGMIKRWDNIFEVVAYAHDESFGSSERTEKTYQLYFEDGQFKDFVGEKITKADFIKYSGGKAALDGIEAEGGTVTEILRRANGIVNVNYTADRNGVTYNKYRTYDVSGGGCKETASGYGIYLPSVLNPYSEEQLALHKLIIEASETEGEIINPLFGDFDGDGINEVIAVLGEHNEDETFQIGGSRGELWFASGDKAHKLTDSSSLPLGRPYILKSSGLTFLNIWYSYPGTMGGTSHTAYNYLIKNSEAVEIESYGGVTYCCGDFGDFGDKVTSADLYFMGNEYDGSINSMGTTYKEYWYYYFENKFCEYYGREITEEEFLKYDGAKAVLDKIAADGCTTDKILKRGNGLININYSQRTDINDIGDYSVGNSNITLFYRNGRVTEKEKNDGIYHSYLQREEITGQTDFERFSEMIYDTAEGDENSFIRERFYGDHDSDGKNELYAYYGTDENFSLWFADENGARQASEEELAGIAQTM